MKPRVLTALAVAALTMAFPTIAFAKGASAATIDSDESGGLPGGPIIITGDGEPDSGTELGDLAAMSGLFDVMFEGGPGGLSAAPTDALGDGYTITWTFSGGDGSTVEILQHVYPFAAGGPVTFMPADQPIFDETTTGGWYRASDGLRQHLVSLGLPDDEIVTAVQVPVSASGQVIWPQLAMGAGGVLLVAAVAAFMILRRRTERVPATR